MLVGPIPQALSRAEFAAVGGPAEAYGRAKSKDRAYNRWGKPWSCVVGSWRLRCPVGPAGPLQTPCFKLIQSSARWPIALVFTLAHPSLPRRCCVLVSATKASSRSGNSCSTTTSSTALSSLPSPSFPPFPSFPVSLSDALR